MKETINSFLNEKHIAIAGVSREGKKWGNDLMRELEKKELNIYPINPFAEEINAKKCYKSVGELPPEVKSVVIATAPAKTIEVVKQCYEAGIQRVWMQRGMGFGSASQEAIQYCKDNNLEYVYGFCPMMFFGEGMHKFHFWLRRNLGKMPAEYLN